MHIRDKYGKKKTLGHLMGIRVWYNFTCKITNKLLLNPKSDDFLHGNKKSLEFPHFVIRISVTTFQASSIEGLEMLEMGGEERG